MSEKQSDEERKIELEKELERHKQRFLAASKRSIDVIETDISLATWVGSFPLEAGVIAFLGGLWLGASKPLDRRKASSLG